jgi:RNA polymerase sigma factor (sigma-70 family)
MATSAQRARTPEGLLETGVPLDDATDTRRHRPFVNALPLPPGMPLLHVRGRPLSPGFTALMLGNQILVATLVEDPSLTAADLAGIAFVHALHGLRRRRLDTGACVEAAEFVLALHPRLTRAAGWPDDCHLAARLAIAWVTGPSGLIAVVLIKHLTTWTELIVPNTWRRAAQAIEQRAFDQAARAIAWRRGWSRLDVDTALALGELPHWRDADGYSRIALLKALEPARLPEPAGSPTERVGEAKDVAELPADLGADPEAIARLRAALGDLSPREREVVALLAAGSTPEHTAATLGIQRGTVDVLVSRAKKKIAAA